MTASNICLGCGLLCEAMPPLGEHAPEIWNASVELGARIHGVDPRELAVVVSLLWGAVEVLSVTLILASW